MITRGRYRDGVEWSSRVYTFTRHVALVIDWDRFRSITWFIGPLQFTTRWPGPGAR